MDSGHTHLFFQYQPQVLIDPHSRGAKRILAEAALKKRDECAAILMEIFSPFDAHTILRETGQPADWVTEHAAVWLDRHQDAYVLTQAQALNAELTAQCGSPALERMPKKI